MRSVTTRIESFPLLRPFSIARGSRTQADVVLVMIAEGPHTGRGEGLPYAHYGESPESSVAEINHVASALHAGATRSDLLTLMQPGAARNAVDAALWDLEARISGQSVSEQLIAGSPAPLETMLTVGLDSPENMARAASELKSVPILKVKLGTGLEDIDRIQAVRNGAPDAKLVVDANEGWHLDLLPTLFTALSRANVAMVEQPLPVGQDEGLVGLSRPIPVFADESVKGSPDWNLIVKRYDGVNLKLDKSGGLTAAVSQMQTARDLGLGIMVGCMVATSLSIAPAHILAQNADYVDLDAPFLLAEDRKYAMKIEDGMIWPSDPRLWGG